MSSVDLDTLGGIHAQLLGGARVRLGRRRISFAPEKRYQFLAYLAYVGDWVGRERLAYLFWPDTEGHKAQQNLRQLLRRVRQLEWLGDLEVTDHRLRWAPPTDAAAFHAALAADRLDEALTLYDGSLLAGMETDDAPEFCSWLEFERAHLHARWRAALLSCAQALPDAPAEAARLLSRLLEHDPLDEEALQGYLWTAGKAGQRPQALAAYRAFARTLHDELGLEPTSTTRGLAERLERGEDSIDLGPSVVTGARAPPTPLPVPATSFVGREPELADIAGLLAQPGCRLLTLLGPGGIGKSRLALRAAVELGGRYPDGVVFVPLEALSHSDAIPERLAGALGLTPLGPEEPLAQVVRDLGEKRVLLVLDNFEHLLDGAASVSRLLGECPRLTLLATSRARLDLTEEWLLRIEGLPLPGAEEPLASDAVTLFMQRAGQIQPDFTATPESLPAIVRICELVQGSPLAIELAAVWVRLLSPAEIAREIETNLDLLATSVRNVPERQRSLRATFEHSWRLLTPGEQAALRRLSIFRGGFTREGAAGVAGASVAVLAALLDKSLLRVAPGGRYDRHPLLHQFTQEKLTERPEERKEVRARHGRFFRAFLVQQEAEPDLKRALDSIDEEMENLLVALDWLVGAHPTELHRLLYRVDELFDLRGTYQRSRELFAWLGARLDEHDPSHHATLGTFLVYQAWACLRLRRYREGRELAERGLALANPRDAPVGILLGHNTLAAIACDEGRFVEAKRIREAQAGLIREIGEKEYLPAHLATKALAANTANTGGIETALGDYEGARRCYERAAALNRSIDHSAHLADNLIDLGNVLLLMGKPQEALEPSREGLDLARAVGMQRAIPTALTDLAAIHFELGEHERAVELTHEALLSAQVDERPSAEVDVHLLLGRALLGRADDAQVEDHLMRALATAWKTQTTPKVLEALATLGALRLRQGRAEEAAALLPLAVRHPNTEHAVRQRAERTLSELRARWGTERSPGPEQDPLPELREIVEGAMRRRP